MKEKCSPPIADIVNVAVDTVANHSQQFTGVAVPPAALQLACALQHTFCVPTTRMSEQQHAAPLLCSLLRSERLHEPATAPSIDSAFVKLLARRLIDHSGR